MVSLLTIILVLSSTSVSIPGGSCSGNPSCETFGRSVECSGMPDCSGNPSCTEDNSGPPSGNTICDPPGVVTLSNCCDDSNGHWLICCNYVTSCYCPTGWLCDPEQTNYDINCDSGGLVKNCPICCSVGQEHCDIPAGGQECCDDCCPDDLGFNNCCGGTLPQCLESGNADARCCRATDIGCVDASEGGGGGAPIGCCPPGNDCCPAGSQQGCCTTGEGCAPAGFKTCTGTTETFTGCGRVCPTGYMCGFTDPETDCETPSEGCFICASVGDGEWVKIQTPPQLDPGTPVIINAACDETGSCTYGLEKDLSEKMCGVTNCYGDI
ncbi:MAG: hypothetical protein ABH851_03070, partial [Methanobacteriota archaeon]